MLALISPLAALSGSARLPPPYNPVPGVSDGVGEHEGQSLRLIRTNLLPFRPDDEISSEARLNPR